LALGIMNRLTGSAVTNRAIFPISPQTRLVKWKRSG